MSCPGRSSRDTDLRRFPSRCIVPAQPEPSPESAWLLDRVWLVERYARFS